MSNTKDKTKGNNQKWWRNLLRSRSASGDVIASQVGEGARGIATGKNIIQIIIGSLNIPRYAQIALLCCTIGIIIFIGANYYQLTVIGHKIAEVIRTINTPRNTPSRMEGPFNVAIAIFTVVDSNGRLIQNQMTDIGDIGIDIPDYLYRKSIEANSEVSSLTEIWPPTRTGQISNVTDDERRKEVELLSERLNADIVVYGVITETVDTLVIRPEFYVRYHSFDDGQEIAGQHELGGPFSVPNTSEGYWASKRLNIRLQVLIIVTAGLAYFHFEDYEAASKAYRRVFEEVYKKSEFDCLNGDEGQDVIHLLVANANLMLASKKKPDAYLDIASKHYDCAISLNPTYARAAIGQAIILTKQALGDWNEQIIPENINTTLLTDAELHLNNVLSFTFQPEFADIKAKVHFNLGQLYFYRFMADKDVFRENLLEKAEQQYKQVIDQFNDPRRIKGLAAHAYSNLGLIANLRDNPKIAIGYLQNAVKIADNYDANKGRYYYQLGDYYVEAGQTELAASAYTMCAEITAPKGFNNPDRFNLCCHAVHQLEANTNLKTLSSEHICKNPSQ